jgi:hypothetical protein
MPEFKYTGSEERYYPSLALLVDPGDSVTLDADPGDGRFSPADGSASVSAPVVDATPVSDPEPVADVQPADSPEVGV